MAVYGQLLIDAGGGVIDHAKQSEKAEGATVIIGLGGTGTSAVSKIKKEVFTQLKPDDVDATIPTYGAIRYLVVDSDPSDIEKRATGEPYDIDVNNEFFDISNKSIKTEFEAVKILEKRTDLKWLDYQHLSPDTAANGAGGVRQVGRFLLVDKAELFKAKLSTIINAALKESKNSKLNIHILAGISGGTGSGTFIDVCYIVHHVLQEIGQADAMVSGYFFLPDVNLSVPEVAASPTLAGYIKVNGYSALQELDYCMNFDRNRDSFKMTYKFGNVDYNTKPVDLCYLVSTIDQNGNHIKNGYQYAMGVVADYIISYLGKGIIAGGGDDKDGVTIAGHIANLKRMKDGIALQHGAGNDYNVLGSAVAMMPLSEIATYLGAKLFGAYDSIYGRAPSQAERDNFLTVTQLQYDNIQDSVADGCAKGLGFPPAFDANMYKNMGNRRFVERADEFLDTNRGKLAENQKKLTEKLGDPDITSEGTSLITRTFKRLFDLYVTSLDYGPFFTKRMIFGNNNPNLLQAVEGMIVHNNEALESEVRQDKLRHDALTDAEARMDASSFINAGHRIDEYKAALANWYMHLYRIDVIKTMGDVLQEYKRQLTDLDNSFFRVLTNVLDTLRETFETNARVLSEGVREENSYTWKILSVPDIIDGLDEVIKKLDVQKTLSDLMIGMFTNCKKWIGEDDAEIVKLISEFVLKEFEDATKKTMTDYLKEKYQTSGNDELLANAIEADIMEDKLWSKSTPLFWQNQMYHNPVGMLTTLTVPYDSNEIKLAAGKLSNAKGEVKVRPSYITDKISLMRFYSGLPLYSYQGIHEYERAYEADNNPVGRHLFEVGDVNWNEILPSPIPASFDTNRSSDRIMKKNERLMGEFARAEELGIIAQNDIGMWFVHKTDALDVDALKAELDAIKEMRPCQEYVNKMTALKAERAAKFEEIRLGTATAQPGAEKQVVQDFYLLSPKNNQLVRDEIAKVEAIDSLAAEAEAKFATIKGQTGSKKEFFDAIFSGILPYGKKIVFTYDEFGIEKSVDLQNLEMPYGYAGAYQAYITYQTIDAKVKDLIIKATKARVSEDDSPEIKATVADLDASMPKKIQAYLSYYDADPKIDEIRAFYDEFMKEFATFKMLNM